MSEPRLARLRAVRAVEQRVALMRLAALQRAVAEAGAIGDRVERLIADLPDDGGARQPVAATRLALVAVRERIGVRLDTAAAARSAAIVVLHRAQRRVEVIDDALARRPR